MIGKTHMIWLGLIGLSSGILFHTSYEVQALEEKLANVNREIIQEQEAIQVLKAEWSYLNDPVRLETLARKYTLLAPSGAVQLAASIEEIPFPAPGATDPALVASIPIPARKPGATLVADDRPPTAPPLLIEETTPTFAAQGQVAAIPQPEPEPDPGQAPQAGVIFANFGSNR